MRVIAGQFRRRPLQSLPGLDLRPTSDRLRETLFDVLSAARELSNTVWLDLFAGTGAVGIEALSRGARQVYFVESSKRHARLLRDNLAALDITSGYELHEREVAKALPLLETTGVVCDLCFLDPPYQRRGAYEHTLGCLSQSRLLALCQMRSLHLAQMPIPPQQPPVLSRPSFGRRPVARRL